MIIIDGVKYACERCIRGHRVTKCSHSDGPLVVIKPKGRPSTVCDYCKLMKKNHNANPTGSCVCGRQQKLEQKKQKLLEEKKAKKLKEKALLNEQNGDIVINDDNFSQQSSMLSLETNHAISCSCYETGVCNCHKKRKNASSTRQRKSTAGISKRRNSNSSFDLSSKFLGSHQSDYLSVNSGFDNSSLYSYDSFSNAVFFPNANNYHSKISPNSQNNGTPGLFPSQNVAKADNNSELKGGEAFFNPSPEDRSLPSTSFLSPSSNNKINANESADIFENSVKSNSCLDVQSLTNGSSMNTSNSFASFSNQLPRRVSSVSNFQNLDNDYMHLNEHRKTHWQLHHNNGSKKLESLQSVSTNNDINQRTRNTTGMNYNFLESSKHNHGLLDNVADSSKYNVNTYLDSLDRSGVNSRTTSGSDSSPLQHFQTKSAAKNNRGKSGNSPLVPSNLADRNTFENNSNFNQRSSFSGVNNKLDPKHFNKKVLSTNFSSTAAEHPIDRISPSDFINSKNPITNNPTNSSVETSFIENEVPLLSEIKKEKYIPLSSEDPNEFENIFFDALKNPGNTKSDAPLPQDITDLNIDFLKTNENQASLPHLSKDFLDLLNTSPDALFGSIGAPDSNNQVPEVSSSSDVVQTAANNTNNETIVEHENSNSKEEQNGAVLLSLRPATFGLSNFLGTVGNDEYNRSSPNEISQNNTAQLL